MKNKLPTSKKKLINKEEFEKSAKAALDLCISCGEPVVYCEKPVVYTETAMTDYDCYIPLLYCDNEKCPRCGLLTAVTK